MLGFGAAEVTLYTPHAARIVIRIGYSRWLSLVDAYGEPLPGPSEGDTSPQPCLSGLAGESTGENPPMNWLVLRAPQEGVYQIAAPYKMPRGSACPDPD